MAVYEKVKEYGVREINNLMALYGCGDEEVDTMPAVLVRYSDNTYHWFDNTLHSYSKNLDFYPSEEEAEKALAEWHAQ